MQPPTPTKAPTTPAKLKTFVQANGALLAEQEVIEYQQTPYEVLRFVHQDASGTGVQQTLADGTLAVPNGRTAEYDAMGRNVADPGPYVMLNTQLPSENGSGIDLFGNGEGYRPGRSTYKVNGFVVPESTFMMHIGSFTFDLIQVAAQMSRMQFLGYTLRYGNGDETFAGFDEARAISRMEGGETLVRNWLVNYSWSIISLINPVAGHQETASQGQEDDPVERFVKRGARKVLDDETNNCTRILKWADLYNAVSNKLESTTFVSVSERGSEAVGNFFDVANPNETLETYFRGRFEDSSHSLENVAIAGTRAIATMDGARSFVWFYGVASSRASEVRVGFFLHELVHHATGLTDEDLERRLLQPRRAGDDRSSADRISEFFNSGCPFILSAPPPRPNRE